MFKCELCGGEYETKEAAIKCIMKCARKAYDEGRFIPKEVPYREGETIVINELFTDPVSKKCREDIDYVINKLLAAGIPEISVKRLKYDTIKDWDNIDIEEKNNRYNNLVMVAKLYQIEI